MFGILQASQSKRRAVLETRPAQHHGIGGTAMQHHDTPPAGKPKRMGRPRSPFPPLKPCVVCGEIVPRRPSDSPSTYHKRSTCSPTCSRKWRSLSQKQHVPVDPDKTCVACGKHLVPRDGEPEHKYQARKTCNHDCKVRATAKTRRSRYTATKQCVICGKVFQRRHNEAPVAFKGRRACGRTCGFKLGGLVYSEKYGSHSAYPRVFSRSLKEAIRERDGHRCQLCGGKGGKRKLSIHHINYDKGDCATENLIALCGSCHSRTNANRAEWQALFSRMMQDRSTQDA